MIAIASSNAAELGALTALCEIQGWAVIECISVRAAIRSLQRHRPRIIVTRQRLDDGYSDDLIAAIGTAGIGCRPRVVVLLEAGVPSSVEVRQITLGADCVLRNPIRTDVLTAYVANYLKAKSPGGATEQPGMPGSGVAFCGGTFSPFDRTLQHAGEQVSLTPREAVLVDVLTQAPGTVASYERLYGEILGRSFRGDTSNMRVLLGKLSVSCRSIGLSVRPYIQVIPKTGYRYLGPPAAERVQGR